MKKICDFKALNNSELTDVRGGLMSQNCKAGFVHTGYEFFAGYISDVFYDEDGNGQVNSDAEAGSYISVIADPPKP